MKTLKIGNTDIIIDKIDSVSLYEESNIIRIRTIGEFNFNLDYIEKELMNSEYSRILKEIHDA